MQTYQRFIFESYELDTKKRTIQLRYSLDDRIKFSEIFTLPKNIPLNFDHPDLDAALFALHLSGGASYYKTSVPKTIEVNSGKLDTIQAAFWTKLYTHGLGQFFYENGIDFRGLINFPVSPGYSASRIAPRIASKPKKALVPFGGGKDSIVTSQLLRTIGLDQTLFRLRSHKLITKLAHVAQLPLIEADRTLAPELFELNEAGAWNGHIPITAHISFLTIVISLLAGFDSVFFSNERSSSYGNVSYLGMEVNHQWSKSLEAQDMLSTYLSDFVTDDVLYLNILRPLSELQIAKLFTLHPQFLGYATSCNRNWTITERSADAPRWCCKCPKCAFSFALLAAFLPIDTVIQAFGENLFNNQSLLTMYRELWGVEGFKPFECVGTPQETRAAFYLAHKQNPSLGGVVMTHFVDHILPTIENPEELVQQLLTPDKNAAPLVTRDILEKCGIL